MDCENCRHLTVVGLHDTGPCVEDRQAMQPISEDTQHVPLVARGDCTLGSARFSPSASESVSHLEAAVPKFVFT